MRHLAIAVLLVLLPSQLPAQAVPGPAGPSQRWVENLPTSISGSGPTVPGYLEEMTWKAIPQEVLLIAGSSTAWRWDVQKWFSDYRVVNRGFGGSRIDDATFFAEQLILPFRPTTIVLSSGDTDLIAGATPAETLDRLREFARRIAGWLPRTQIVFASIVPGLVDSPPEALVRQTNSLIREWVESEPNLWYVDFSRLMYRPDGALRTELLGKDRVSLSQQGYLELTLETKPTIRKAEQGYRQLAPESPPDR